LLGLFLSPDGNTGICLHNDRRGPAGAQKCGIRRSGGKGDGAVIGCVRFGPARQTAQQIGPGCVELRIVIQRPGKRFDLSQCGGQHTGFGQRHRAVLPDDRRRLHPQEAVVKQGDLASVGAAARFRLHMQGGDGGLDLKRTRRVARYCPVQQAQLLADHHGVPQAAILRLQRHEGTLRDAGRPAGMGQRHQRKKAFAIGFVRTKAGQQARQKARLRVPQKLCMPPARFRGRA